MGIKKNFITNVKNLAVVQQLCDKPKPFLPMDGQPEANFHKWAQLSISLLLHSSYSQVLHAY
jgi:hypothetical protein